MKFINKLIVTCPVFVLSLGLISCSPEQSERDAFRLQEPEIFTEKSTGTKISNLEPGNTWSLEDRIRFQETDRSSLKLQIKSTCKSLQTNEIFDGSQTRALPKEVFIGEILPVSLLTRKNPLSSTQFQCSFTFIARNDKGSQHKFQLAARLLEEQPHKNRNTNIQVNGSPLETKEGEWPELKSSDLEKFWLMSARADHFQLSCNDLKTALQSKNDLIALTDLIRTLDTNKIQTSVQRSPEQTCRVLAFQNGSLQGWSSYFKIVWSSSKLQIQAVRLLPMIFNYSAVNMTTQKLYEVKIRNPYPFPVYFSLPSNKNIKAVYQNKFSTTVLANSPLRILFDKNTNGLILNTHQPNRLGLNAGAEVKVTLETQLIYLNMNSIALGFPFQSHAAMQIKRFENMKDELEVGSQDLIPRQLIFMHGDNVQNFRPYYLLQK